ncbi:hypothetical protein INR49_007961 [Caranx melampygus]|nr:hypothetical protein INR49_007961 [Caranx melampygus]
MESFAVIIVHKDKTNGVQIGELAPQSPDWQELKGTDYVSTSLTLTVSKNIIWHKSSNMAVYFVGKTETSQFGNPAAIITMNPDVRGCPLTPEVIEIGDVAMGWRESLQYCKEKDLELVSLSDSELWEQIHRKITLTNTNRVQRLWIGLRRSSRTGQWYWLNNDPVTDTNWRKGEPGMVHDGQCTIMSLDKDFMWSDEDCCKKAYPLCYRDPVLLPF